MGTTPGGINGRVNARPACPVRLTKPAFPAARQQRQPLQTMRQAAAPATNSFTIKRRLSWEAVSGKSMKHHSAYWPYLLALLNGPIYWVHLTALALWKLVRNRFVVSLVSVKCPPHGAFS